MKLTLMDSGDGSVGIEPVKVIIDFDFVVFTKEDHTDRKNIKKDLKKVFLNYGVLEGDDKSISAWFDDECPDCGMPISDKKECQTEGCIIHEMDKDVEDYVKQREKESLIQKK